MRVLFTAQPGHGHVGPLLPVAHATDEAGHDVRLGTSASALASITERQVPGFPVGLDWTLADAERAFPELRGRSGLAGKHYLLEEIFCGVTAETTARDVVALAEKWRPDVIVREVWEFGGALAAAHLGIPSVVHGIGTWRNVEEVQGVGADRLREAWRALNYRGDLLGAVPGQLYLDPCPEFLQTPTRPGWPRARQALRPVPVGRLAPGDGAVLVTLGTVMHRQRRLMESILDGVTALERPVVATTGPGMNPTDLRRRFPGITVVEYRPLAEVLPSTGAVVCHGGWNTVLAALGHGLPLVIVPLGADTPINAARCEAAGLSITVERGPDLARTISEATHAVLTDPRYRRAAAAASDAIARMPPPEHAVAGIAALAR